MKRRRFIKAGFNQKLIMDVGLAGIAVRIVPLLLNKFVPLDPTLYTVAGAGGGYLVGSMLKKPDLANASIALGLVEFVAPMIENLVSGSITSTPTTKPIRTNIDRPFGQAIIPVTSQTAALNDYLNLNDYISNPGVRQGVDEYRTSY